MPKESSNESISIDQIAESVTAGVLRAIDARRLAKADRVGGFDIHIAGGRFEFFVGSGALEPSNIPGRIGPGGASQQG
jgi:hypothetical protein